MPLTGPTFARKLLVILGLAALVACAVIVPSTPVLPTGIVLYAQTVPTTVTATWTPNATTDNATAYTVTLDSGIAISVPLTACTASLCTQIVTVSAFGAHLAHIAAQNLKLTSDPTSTETGPATSVAFTLNQLPGAVAGAAVGK